MAPCNPGVIVQSSLPTGTVTFLFTDIEGSTRLLGELGPARYAEALAEHHRVIRDALAREGGVEVGTEGDAFFVAFETAPAALAAAADAQEALSLPVRMGIHTGSPLLSAEGYVGIDLHKAARIAAAAHGGQVLVSASTAALIDPGESRLLDLGEHRLKDLSAPERIYQAGEGEFPPLRTLYRTNLPVPATPFLGRERELADVRELLGRDEVRLLTLTGPGGTGKTRLALQAAGAAADSYPDGVFWVPLAPIRDPALVLESARQALDAPGGLKEHVSDKRMLLLLDNFEQVMGAAEAVGALVNGCPNLRLLVTSRELLRLPGEQAYPVPPLDPADGTELFLARARSVKPDFESDEAVPELCRRLEQLPLALELAAARISILSPAQLLDRLGQRLDVLKAGRGVDPRQQTLRATIEWSHDLLEQDEQRLFAQLAVFRGGFTLEAAEQVCDAGLDTLQSLVDKSLLRVRDDGRFWMLETVREYAAERLDASSEADALHRRLAQRMLELSREAKPGLAGAAQPTWIAAIEAERDNVRVALEWAFARDEVVLAVELAANLGRFWWPRGPAEGLAWLERGLQTAELDDRLRAEALEMAGPAAYFVRRHEHAVELLTEAVEISRRLGDRARIARVLTRIAPPLGELGRGDECHRAAEEAVAINRELDERGELAIALQVLSGGLERRADARRMEALLAESVRLARDLGDSFSTVWGLHNLAELALEQGRVDRAASLASESLELAHELGDDLAVLICLAILAGAASKQGDVRRAGLLWGAAERLDHELGETIWRSERAEAEAMLGEPTPDFSSAVEEGRRLATDEAVAVALSDA